MQQLTSTLLGAALPTDTSSASWASNPTFEHTAESQPAATVSGGSKKPRTPRAAKPLDLQTIVQRMRISYPALRAAKIDPTLRQLVLAELIGQCYNESGSIVVPDGAMI